MKTKLEIFTILPKITINWEIYIHFIKVFYIKVSRIRRLTSTNDSETSSRVFLFDDTLSLVVPTATMFDIKGDNTSRNHQERYDYLGDYC